MDEWREGGREGTKVEERVREGGKYMRQRKLSLKLHGMAKI